MKDCMIEPTMGATSGPWQRRIKTGWPVLALALVAGAVSLSAQTFEQVAPNEMPQEGDQTTSLSVSEREQDRVNPSDEERVLVEALRGLVFVAESAGVRPEGRNEEGVLTRDVPLLDTAEFRELVAPRLGQPLTLGTLKKITQETVAYLRGRDRPVVDVVVPEQNIATGTVQILVREGRLGAVKAERNQWFSSERIVSAVRAKQGDSLSGRALLEDLTWLNQNPFRRVDLVFAAGERPGETDVILKVEDRRPVRLYAGFDDSGTTLTKRERVFAGINWGNAFDREHQLNYQFTASPDLEKMMAHSISYVVPLPGQRHTLTVFGSYAESQPDLPFFTLEGQSWQVGLRYRVPLRAWRGVEQSLTGGVDFKRSNNDLAFGGTSVFAQATDVAQLVLEYAASRPDRRGATSGALTFVWSPGGMGGRNSDSDFRASRSLAEARYGYARLVLERATRLPGGWSWIVRGQGQVASTNLMGSEQFGLGGASLLRGYEEREANGDGGVALVNEVRTAPASLGGGRLVPLAFFDAGRTEVHTPLVGEARARNLASAGIGVRYTLGATVVARADFGWQLRESGVSPTRDDRRGHVSVTVGW